MQIKRAFAMLLLVPSLGACGSTAPPDNDPTGTPTGGCALAGTDWNLSGTGDELGNMVANNMTLNFDDETSVSGSGGVSDFSGKYTAQPTGQLSLTDLKGPAVPGDDGANQAQAEYLKTLGSVTGYTCKTATLGLFAGDRQVYVYVPG